MQTQQIYIMLLYECDCQSGAETYEQVGHLHHLSPEFKHVRDANMARYGLNLWGDAFLRFHNPHHR